VNLAQRFARTGFAKFINSPTGRVTRVVAGLALLLWGYSERVSTTGLVLMVVALVPLAAGSFDLCLISALLGGPIRGAVLRKPD